MKLLIIWVKLNLNIEELDFVHDSEFIIAYENFDYYFDRDLNDFIYGDNDDNE